MAGRGPAPKDPSQRARRNADPVPLRLIEGDPTEQPDLPELMPNGDPWPSRTVTWWRMWGDSGLTDDFRDTDWSELLDTAVLHGLYWSGDTRWAGELRLRTGQHGATAESRLKLRKQYADVREAESKPGQSTNATNARQRRGPLKAVEDAPADAG